MALPAPGPPPLRKLVVSLSFPQPSPGLLPLLQDLQLSGTACVAPGLGAPGSGCPHSWEKPS